LPLFRIDSERIKKDHSHWKQGYSDSILLVTINSKRIDLGNMETAGIDWSKFDVGKAVEGLNEEEKAEKLRQIEIIREMQKKVKKIKKYTGNIKKMERRRKKGSKKAKKERRRRNR